MKLASLNGWQRLWVLLTVLYAIPVMTFAVLEMPSESGIKRAWAQEIIDAVRQDLIEGDDTPAKRFIADKSSYEIRQWIYPGDSDDEVIRKATSTARAGTRPNFSARVAHMEHQFQARLADLWIERLKVLGIGILVWAITATIVYALGAGIGWVARGFRTKQSGD